MPINHRSCVKISLYFWGFTFSFYLYKQSSNVSIDIIRVFKRYNSTSNEYEKHIILNEKDRMVQFDNKLDSVTKSFQGNEKETLENAIWIMKRKSFNETDFVSLLYV